MDGNTQGGSIGTATSLRTSGVTKICDMSLLSQYESLLLIPTAMSTHYYRHNRMIPIAITIAIVCAL